MNPLLEELESIRQAMFLIKGKSIFANWESNQIRRLKDRETEILGLIEGANAELC